MSDPVTMARDARQALAQLQFSLQSAADVPSAALDATVALAQAGAALLPIERSLGATILPHATQARDRALEARACLAPHAASPAVQRVLAALAITLAQLEALAATSPHAAPAPHAAAPPASGAAPRAPVVGPSGTIAQAPHAAAFVQAASGTGTVPAGDAVSVSVTLDATDTAASSNFYCRLWGNDVVAQGGLFVVASGPHPGVGTPVRVSVSLPGGSFDATGVVRWTRSQASADGPPGFGLSFVEITHDAHQRVNAYARARRPFTYPRE